MRWRYQHTVKSFSTFSCTLDSVCSHPKAAAGCGFASIAGSTFNANKAAGAGGALSSNSGTLPVALSCAATSKSALPTFPDAAAQQAAFKSPSFPAGVTQSAHQSRMTLRCTCDPHGWHPPHIPDDGCVRCADCKSSFVGNTAGAYGNDLATGPSSLKVCKLRLDMCVCLERSHSSALHATGCLYSQQTVPNVAAHAVKPTAAACSAPHTTAATSEEDKEKMDKSVLQVVPTFVARQRSNQRLPVTVDIVDDLGQQISGQFSKTSAVIEGTCLLLGCAAAKITTHDRWHLRHKYQRLVMPSHL